MILKEREGIEPSSKTGKAGYQSEKQMAFYLRRAFAENDNIFVLNDLKLTRLDETAQIDHLVLHPYGFVIVESKSVTGSVEVNKQLEFVRVYNNKRFGIQSPINQARLQANVLLALLNDHKDSLRRKILFGLIKGHFGDERIQTVVAISDQGVIVRKDCDPIELVKADAVADRILEIIRQKKQTNLPPYTPEEMSKIANLLLSVDQKARSISNQINYRNRENEEEHVQEKAFTPCQEVPASLPSRDCRFSCSKCSDTHLEIRYGKYGYYFKCQVCDGSMAISSKCETCGEKSKLRKRKNKFDRVCDNCGSEFHFFSNH